MSMSGIKYSVRLPFAACKVSAEWLGSKFLATLDALTQIDPNIFPDWEVCDLPAMKKYPLAAVRSRIAEIIVGNNVIPEEFDDPDGEQGFTAVADTTIKAPRRMTFWADQDEIHDSTLWLNAGDVTAPPDPTIVTYPLFRGALLAINAIWQQPWACAQAFRSRTAEIPTKGGGYELTSLPMIPGEPTFPESIFHIPWFAYLSAPLAADVTLPELQIERLADGGALLVATEQRLDPDPARSRATRAHIGGFLDRTNRV